MNLQLNDLEKSLFLNKSINPHFGNTRGETPVCASFSIKKCINIKGKNAFRVAIIRQGKYNESGAETYLTVDDALQFDDPNTYGEYGISDNNNITKIRITKKSKEEIMQEIERILNLSNEEIMAEFNIKDMGNSFLPIALLVDDIVQRHLESNLESKKEIFLVDNKDNYDHKSIVRENKDILIQQAINDGICHVIIAKKQNNHTQNTDYIKYSIEKNGIKLNVRKLTSKLGEEILQMLKERFEEKQVSDNKVVDGHRMLLQVCKEPDKNITWLDMEKIIAKALKPEMNNGEYSKKEH